MFTEQLSQSLSMPKAALPPANAAANTAANSSGWISGPVDMSVIRRAIGILNVGAITGDGSCTVIGKFLASNSSNTSCYSLWTAVSGGPTVTINTNNKVGMIEMRANQMPSGTRYLTMLVNNQCASFFDAVLLGGEAAYKPSSQNDANSTLLDKQVM